jgi:putative bacteriocin precursor
MKKLQKRNNVEVKSVEAFVTRGSCSCSCTCITGNLDSILGHGGLTNSLNKNA